MPQYGVEFRGGLGNLAQWDAAIKNTVNSNAAAIQAANQKIFQGMGNIQPFKKDEAGLFYRNIKTQVDGINRTFVQSGQVLRQVVSGYEVSFDKISKRGKFKPIFDEQYHANFKQTIGDLDAYLAAQQEIEKVEKKVSTQRLLTAKDQSMLLTRQNVLEEKSIAAQKEIQRLNTSSAAAQKITRINQDIQKIVNAGQQTIPTTGPYRYPAGTPGGLGGKFAPLGTQIPNPQLTALQGNLAKEQAALSALTKAHEAMVTKAEAGITKLKRAYAQLATSGEQAAAKLRAANPAYAARDAAITATPPIQRDLAQAISRYPDLQKQLLRQGLGNGVLPSDAAGFQKALADQKAQVTRYTKNMRTGITNIQGSFKDASGVVNTFTADIDKQGKVIGRWGGNLAGGGTYLKQTVRDFQKVVQWTVATTLVFGTLAATVAQLKNINELNSDLTRLSITAQTTAEETNQLFNSLGQVAIDTATPLKEIINVADDVALATREAGQSADEWRQKIVELTTAVGIYTNLTGTDTTEATDQLSAAFKQLDIAPNEVVGVLSKVTAVAGGQAQAIGDIVKSVASLAEAAKAAGFTLDQQIASVQVLSQVTNKSAADVATAFKNLFGSISSVGSIKILKEFGIEVRDSTGGVKDFLDIYHEISDALAKGIIPQNRLPDVLRGISGGPRRAPDAAALLANLGKIDEVIGKSVGASNEALIANAQVLDTNQAKITQLQNAIDIKVFKQLGQTVSDLVDILTKFGNVFANAFGAVPPQLISMAVQLGLMLVTFRSLIGLGKLFGGAIKSSLMDATRGVQLFNAELAVTASGLISTTGAPIPSPTPNSPAVKGGKLAGLKNFLGSKAGKVALGVGAAGGIAAGLSAGGVNISDIGLITQSLGGIATFIPGLQAVGIAALAVGTGLQFIGSQAETAKKSTADLSKEVYTLSQNLQTTQDTAKGYADAQKEALDSVKHLNLIQNKTAEDQTALSASLQSYVENTLKLSAANREVSKSFDELLTKLPGLKDFQQYAITSPDSPGIKTLLQDLSKQLLEGAGQQLFNTTSPVSYATGVRSPTGNSTIATFPYGSPDRSGLKSAVDPYDLSNLRTNPSALNNLVDASGKFKFNNQQDISSLGIGYIRNALQDLITQGPASGLSSERTQQLIDAVQGLASSLSSYDQNIIALTQQNAQISSKVALGIFTQDQGKNATSATGLIAALTDASKNPRVGGSEYGSRAFAGSLPGLIGDLNKFAETGTAVSTDKLVEVGKALLTASDQYQEVVKLGDEAVNRGIVESLKEAGISGDLLDSVMKRFGFDAQVAADAAAALADAIAEAALNAKATARDQFAQRSLSLISAANSGQYADNAKGLQILKDQNIAAYNSTLKLIDSISELGETSFVDLANALSQVNGLQNLYIDATQFSALTDEQKAETVAALSGKLIDAAIAAGLNADQIKEMTNQVLTLGVALDTLPAYKQVYVDVVQHYTSLGVPENYAQQSATEAAKDAAAKSQADLKKLLDKLLGSGKGSNLGALSKAAKAAKSGSSSAASVPSPGLLDIPDEIKQSGNYQSLLQQAISNARKLQGIVPGEASKNKNDIVELLDGTKRVLETRGIGEEYLRRALDELTGQIKKNNDLLSKADTIRRIRVGAGDFSALANVPVNSQSGVSVGGPNGPVNVTLNINGTVLTPAQFSQFADLIAASIKQQLTS